MNDTNDDINVIAANTNTISGGITNDTNDEIKGVNKVFYDTEFLHFLNIEKKTKYLHY